ncbi:prepilin-type N-terminal cleavage/methylation domain-containing protein [Elusimicrobium simillimum]|uniref:type IV pilin protein n=1 Tax=Elusimicrobium simillimum TaxID=3143438 RepID=UPI003C6FBED1
MPFTPPLAIRYTKQNCCLKKCSSGFTLIELLVVVLIIGILAAIALPQYNKAVAKSRIAALTPAIEAVYTAQKIYFMSHGEYAKDLNDLDLTISGIEFKNSSGQVYRMYLDSKKKTLVQLSEGAACGQDTRVPGVTVYLFYNRDARLKSCYAKNAAAAPICKAFSTAPCNKYGEDGVVCNME